MPPSSSIHACELLVPIAVAMGGSIVAGYSHDGKHRALSRTLNSLYGVGLLLRNIGEVVTQSLPALLQYLIAMSTPIPVSVVYAYTAPSVHAIYCVCCVPTSCIAAVSPQPIVSPGPILVTVNMEFALSWVYTVVCALQMVTFLAWFSSIDTCAFTAAINIANRTVYTIVLLVWLVFIL